jgi:CheY-like chemotaxis protein
VSRFAREPIVTGPEGKPLVAAKVDLACLEKSIAQSPEGTVTILCRWGDSLADDGATALTAPVVTPMDVQMLGWMACKRSLQFGRERRSAEGTIIALTVHDTAGGQTCYIEGGMESYIAKPIGSRKLFDTVPRALLRSHHQNVREKDHVAPA